MKFSTANNFLVKVCSIGDILTLKTQSVVYLISKFLFAKSGKPIGEGKGLRGAAGGRGGQLPAPVALEGCSWSPCQFRPYVILTLSRECPLVLSLPAPPVRGPLGALVFTHPPARLPTGPPSLLPPSPGSSILSLQASTWTLPPWKISCDSRLSPLSADSHSTPRCFVWFCFF